MVIAEKYLLPIFCQNNITANALACGSASLLWNEIVECDVFYISRNCSVVAGLKQEATHELMHNMTTKNVVNILLLADKHEINELKDRALEFISEHGTDVTECEDWKKLAEKAELMTAVFKATAAKVPANSVNST